MGPTDARAERTDQLLTRARRLASALRRERARAGMAGYDPQRHRRLVEEFTSTSRCLPRSLRLRPMKEYLLKKEKSHNYILDVAK